MGVNGGRAFGWVAEALSEVRVLREEGSLTIQVWRSPHSSMVLLAQRKMPKVGQ